MYQQLTFDDRLSLEAQLADEVARQLTIAIEQKGKASLAVSGGSTPKGFFTQLSNKPLAWSKVTICLADERWVDQHHEASNSALVKKTLCQGLAAQAHFFELKREGELTQALLEQLNQEVSALLPFDVLMLGMGEDGHTASIFPCSEQVTEGLTTKAPLLKVEPKTAPHTRISFSFSALINSIAIYLQLYGQAKQTVLQQALASQDPVEMPIRAFLHHPQKTVNIYWAE
jgi:6-phosphogluconolactonase